MWRRSWRGSTGLTWWCCSTAGRIIPGVPVYSPFIRRKQHLELE
ncbi:hypothetical protein [Neoroseomonas soli]|nr:hypothetical protein [Neoroseomonas soli]